LLDALQADDHVICKIGLSPKCICPFHSDKTPSFSVYKNGKLGHCFGCDWKGDIYKYVMDYHKVDFPTAVARVQELAEGKPKQGMALPAQAVSAVQEYKPTKAEFAAMTQASSLLANDDALCETVAGQRNWKGSTIKMLALEEALGYSSNSLTFNYESGMKLRQWPERKFCWRFGNPSLWRRCRVAGALHVFVTEGETDAIALIDSGVETWPGTAVVALASATSIPGDIATRLAGKKVTLCLDNDPGGDKATENLKKLLLPLCAEVSVLDLKKGAPVNDVSDLLDGIDKSKVKEEIQARSTVVALPASTDPATAIEKTAGGWPVIKSACDMVKNPPERPQELVEGLLHRGSTMVFGGGAKTNKTFSLMDLAVSVASGKPWWGLPSQAGRVLYIDLELHDSFFASRLGAIVSRKGLTSEDIAGLDVWNLRGHASDLTGMVIEILGSCQGKGYSMIIIDPIYKALGKRDENKAGDINSLLNEVDNLAVQSNAAVVFGHHFSKGKQTDKSPIQRISGSGVFGRSPDAIVVLTPHEEKDVFVVETILRNFKSVDPFCVEFDYPMMMPKDDLDPVNLKGSKKEERFPVELLLKHLRVKPLTHQEWQELCCTGTDRMSERTFADKKKSLIKKKQVVEGAGKKWMLTSEKGSTQNKEDNDKVSSVCATVLAQ